MVTHDPFPHAQPTRHDVALILKLYYGFAATRFGTWCARTVLLPIDDRLMRRSRGRLSIVGSPAMRVLVLTSTGHKSGRPRDTPLTYIRDGHRLLVLGSNLGQPHHPDWSYNLIANPDASVTIAGTAMPVRASLLTGDEREHALAHFLAQTIYRQYHARADRELRLFALARRSP